MIADGGAAMADAATSGGRIVSCIAHYSKYRPMADSNQAIALHRAASLRNLTGSCDENRLDIRRYRQRGWRCDHLKVFANPDLADEWFKENDPEGVAFEYDVMA
jgi:hypothetical protein